MVASFQKPSSTKKPRILLVDDDPNVASAIERSLHGCGIEFQIAYHGMQGISLAVQWHPDVIVTDLQMPFASGEDLIDVISRNHATTRIPIVVLTGNPRFLLTSRWRQMGVIAVLHKPLASNELLRVLLSKRILVDSEAILDQLCRELERERLR